MNHLTDHQDECLTILQEECAEVIQIASKIRRFGHLNIAAGYDRNNYELLEQEMGDILAMMDMVCAANIGITNEGLAKAKANKMKKLSQWMHTWTDSLLK
jgi:NTP pyrophosphatase (non-canonical NTP hydrolase)